MEDGAYHPISNLDGEVLDAQANRLKALWQRLTVAQEPDEDEARREYMTRVILVMISLTMALFSMPILAGWLSGLFTWQDAGTIILSDALVFAGLWLSLRGHWRKGRFIPLLIIFSLASLITANNGFYNTGLLFYIVGILLTSMLVGIKAQWGMVALSAGIYLILGWRYESSSLYDTSTVAITVTSSFVGIALLQWLLIHLLQNAIQRSRHYAERLEQRALELVELNRELHQEITDRERAQKLLRESEVRYRTLFEHAPIGLALADMEGNVLDHNSAILKPGGYSPEDFKGGSNASTLYANIEDRADILAEIQRQGFLEQKEVRFKRKDGTPYDALLSLTPISLDDETYWQAMVEDITERKHSENVLLDLNRALKVLSNCNQAVIRATDETQLLQEICKIITEEGDYHFAWVGYGKLDPRDTFRPVAQAGFEAGYLENFPLTEFDFGSNEQPGQKIQTGRLILGRQLESDPDRIPRRLEDLTDAFVDSISLPLVANNKTLGSLNIYSAERDAFQPAEVQLLEKLAANLAFGIATLRTRAQHSQAEQRIQWQLETMSALRTVDMTITASLDLRFTFDVILNQIIGTLGIDAATILTYKSQIQTLDYSAGRGFRTAALQHTHLRLGQGNAGRAALERQIVHIPDLNNQENQMDHSPKFPDEDFVVYFGVPLIAKGQVKGVLEIFNRAPLSPDQDWMDLLKAMAAQAAIAIDNAELFRGLQQSNQDLLMAYEFTLEGWAKALELRDAETEGHTQRVTDLTLRLARAMGVSEEKMVHIRRGTLLHDIGKMGIPDSILLKPGPLTDEEWEIMRQHPIYAHQLLSHIPYLRSAVEIPYCHHEKWDGSGYPRGLKGQQIPLAARIFAVVDVWDALCSDRPYRDAWPKEKVHAHIQEQSGQHFDPEVVEAFLKII